MDRTIVHQYVSSMDNDKPRMLPNTSFLIYHSVPVKGSLRFSPLSLSSLLCDIVNVFALYDCLLLQGAGSGAK